MTDRPIIFSGPMVRALLDGRKTMTRRLKMQKRKTAPTNEAYDHYFIDSPWAQAQPGDRLWVRESCKMRFLPNLLTGEPTKCECAAYAADDEPVLDPIGFDFAWWYSRPSCPSIHMPRWASRLTLTITATKIERLQDIPLLDVRAEGIEVRNFWLFGSEGAERQKIGANCFRTIWEGLHGRESWDANPEVIALSFTVTHRNIDAQGIVAARSGETRSEAQGLDPKGKSPASEAGAP